MNELEKKILQNLENTRPFTILNTYWSGLISKVQDCNEKLFIMNNIAFFRESENKIKNNKPIYYYGLQEIILKINDILKNASQTRKFIIEGAEDLFYYPAIFRYRDGNYFYFTDEMAVDYSFYLLGSEIQFTDSVITHHHILALKKIFYLMSKTNNQKSISLLWSLNNFYNLYHEIMMRYEQTMKAERNGDRGRGRTGVTKLDDRFMKKLKPGITHNQVMDLIDKKFPNISKNTRKKYIDSCKKYIEKMRENSK